MVCFYSFLISERAKIYLSSKNIEILDKELQENFNISIGDFGSEDNSKIIEKKAFIRKYQMPKLEIIIPVLMPSRYLESMRESLKDIGESCRVNYVLDFATLGVDQEEISRIKLSPSERLFSGQFGSPGKATGKCTDSFTEVQNSWCNVNDR